MYEREGKKEERKSLERSCCGYGYLRERQILVKSGVGENILG